MEAVWDFYGPWLGLMLWVGLPLLVLGTPALFLLERGSLPRWLAGRVAFLGWVLVLISVVLYLILLVLQDMFSNLPGM